MSVRGLAPSAKAVFFKYDASRSIVHHRAHTCRRSARSSRQLPHFVPRPALNQVAGVALADAECGTPHVVSAMACRSLANTDYRVRQSIHLLLEEKRHAGACAIVSDLARPIGYHRSSAGGVLAAGDDPVQRRDAAALDSISNRRDGSGIQTARHDVPPSQASFFAGCQGIGCPSDSAGYCKGGCSSEGVMDFEGFPPGRQGIGCPSASFVAAMVVALCAG
jgi:hypothetical protein